MENSRPSYLPGGQVLLPSTSLRPFFANINAKFEMFTDTQTMPQYATSIAGAAGDPNAPADAIVAKIETTSTRVLRNKQALIEEWTVERDKETRAVLRDSAHLYCHLWDTLEYLTAEAKFKALLTTKSCYNANLATAAAESGDALTEADKALLRWQDFPFLEYMEEVEYTGTAGLNVPQSASIKIKQSIYDLMSGMLAAEHTYEYAGVVVLVVTGPAPEPGQPEPVEPERASNLESNAHYRYREMVSNIEFATARKIQFRDGLNYWWYLTSIESVEYRPLTPRITSRNVVRRDDQNKAPPNQKTGEYADKHKAAVLTTTSASLIIDSGPRLSRRDLTDLQGRYGPYSVGDLAMKLTARRRGLPTTSAEVQFVVSGVEEQKTTATAEAMMEMYQGAITLGRAELAAIASEVVGEVASADNVIVPLIASTLDIAVVKVQMVISLYRLQFSKADAESLVGYIPQVAAILAEYDTQLDRFLRLYACQRNVSVGLVTNCWDTYRGLSVASVISQWFRTLQERNVVTAMDHGTAMALYTWYVHYRGEIEKFNARVAEEQMKLNLRGFRTVNFSVFNVSDICHIGSAVKVETRRDSLPSGFITAVSWSMSDGGVPTMTVDYEFNQ